MIIEVPAVTVTNEVQLKKGEFKNIKWKRRIFSSTYELFTNNSKIGELNTSNFRSISVGQINNYSFKFQKKSFWRSEIEIVDLLHHTSLGSIKFKLLGYQAEINLQGEKYVWKFENFWRSKWAVYENDFSIINYYKKSFKGEIKSKKENELLLLCGLFVYNNLLKYQ
ncbi:hypothetical protein [Tenacibaculum sp. M341]|uniref:hypothetical protein n=1 Tax=Tenacibaculum sp. M341 TaxID=2530339 RepID=UPI001047D158|nr:hypothetical protein [Tenacibaculum sp. M341]TCI90747.1 hypothetical protein EYW44_13580 [Tenacibaculum sp. M341]